MPHPVNLTHRTTTKSVLDFINLYTNQHLNLEPGFQRQSVWTQSDRSRLMDSILRNYPLPAIFLYRRQEQGQPIFDVIDGKQRLESILMFTGNKRGAFSVRTHLPGAEAASEVRWADLRRKELQHRILGYEIPVVEVDGELGDIIDLFVRINSTGKALTRQEQRHARYYNSPFLAHAAKLAKTFQVYFQDQGVFSAGQLSRMKHIELVCELMLSLLQGDVLNKKTALDRVMATSSFDGRQLGKAVRLTTTTLNRVKRMFPELRSTRLRHAADFYSLAVLIGKFEQEGLILTDRRQNQLAWDLLMAFSTGVDQLRLRQRKGDAAGPDSDLYRDYHMAVSQQTDDVVQRRKRETILRGLLESLFAKRDEQRGFTPEQRRILWNTTENRVCTHPGCRKKLTWDDFTIDHINPHSKGGLTQLNNAALMCREHNSAKGNRKK